MTSPNALELPTNWNLREVELQRVSHALANDEDLLIAGVPGSGRRTLVRQAAKENQALVIEIDCIRAMDGKSFVKLLYENYTQFFGSPKVDSIGSQWVKKVASELFVLNRDSEGRPRLKPSRDLSKLNLNEAKDAEYLWQTFKVLLSFPQFLGKNIDKRVVLILHSFPHIRCWDRQHGWETFLRDEIKKQKNVSYVIVATIAEIADPMISTGTNSNATDSPKTVGLAPLSNEILARWIREALRNNDSAFDPRQNGLETFLDTVQGHYSDARALTRRLLTTQRGNERIDENQVGTATRELLEDFSAVFESLLELLPESQAQLLECLALFPTDKPQSRKYIQEHSLSKGGTLQNALKGLQGRGLIYGSELGYRPALPLLAKWICQQLG